MIYKNQLQITTYKQNNFKEEDFKRKMTPHKHTSLEISYVTSGSLDLSFYCQETAKTEKVSILPHQFFIIKPNCMHCVDIAPTLATIGVEFLCRNNQEVMTYLANSEYINSIESARSLVRNFKDVIIFNDNYNVAYLLNQLKKFTQKTTKMPYQEEIYDLELKRLLIEILRCKTVSYDIKGKNIYLTKALSFMHSNLKSRINANEIAKQLGISRVYLDKMFRVEMKTTVNNEINKLRIENACFLISNTNYPLKVIAFDCGYNSFQSFLTNFKKYTQTTPTEYKKRTIHEDNYLSVYKNSNFYVEKKQIK